MSDLQNLLKRKVELKGAALKEVVDSLPCLSKDSLTEVEAEEACAALAPHLGTASKVMDLIRAKVGKLERVLKKIKPKKKVFKKEEDASKKKE